jgi:hypothetical protein
LRFGLAFRLLEEAVRFAAPLLFAFGPLFFAAVFPAAFGAFFALALLRAGAALAAAAFAGAGLLFLPPLFFAAGFLPAAVALICEVTFSILACARFTAGTFCPRAFTAAAAVRVTEPGIADLP